MYVVVHHRVIDRDNFLATDPREIAGNVPPGDTTYGFRPLERLVDATGGAAVPLLRMEKPVYPSLLL